jgi:hypothetical protein
MLQHGDVGYIKCRRVDQIVLLCCLGLFHTRFLLVLVNVKLCGCVLVLG